MSLNFLGFIKNYPACRPAACKKLLQSQLGRTTDHSIPNVLAICGFLIECRFFLFLVQCRVFQCCDFEESFSFLTKRPLSSGVFLAPNYFSEDMSLKLERRQVLVILSFIKNIQYFSKKLYAELVILVENCGT